MPVDLFEKTEKSGTTAPLRLLVVKRSQKFAVFVFSNFSAVK